MYSFYPSLPKAPLGTFTYTVEPGDTLYNIADRFNTTISNILVFNYIPNPNMLYPGQNLIIPYSPPEAIIYTVKPGDTLYAIAKEYNAKIDVILDFNYLPNPDVIYPGQQLVIPPYLRD
ncbi:LysM peptidoglycan-binding domain-containing protein [Dethiothermospora halolimnae]|uniref:LysM peptidoglycan-binding domain-containing protein n=1 Tax=Dethiothermospora halolimnae TaxID=3114390 RepID=UPI003CCC452A